MVLLNFVKLFKINYKLNRHALIKAKYCPQTALVASAGNNEMTPSGEWYSVNLVMWFKQCHACKKKHTKNL